MVHMIHMSHILLYIFLMKCIYTGMQVAHNIFRLLHIDKRCSICKAFIDLDVDSFTMLIR